MAGIQRKHLCLCVCFLCVMRACLTVCLCVCVWACLKMCIGLCVWEGLASENSVWHQPIKAIQGPSQSSTTTDRLPGNGIKIGFIYIVTVGNTDNSTWTSVVDKSSQCFWSLLLNTFTNTIVWFFAQHTCNILPFLTLMNAEGMSNIMLVFSISLKISFCEHWNNLLEQLYRNLHWNRLPNQKVTKLFLISGSLQSGWI